MSSEYHKIQTVFKRDPDNKHKTLLEGDFTYPVFEALKDMPWVFTEKVDGTNIRIMWDGERVTFGGKTNNAQIPAPLVEHLVCTYTPERLRQGLSGPATIYGEGYGGKIQKGGRYNPAQTFIIFDVLVPHDPLPIWLERPVVEEIAGAIDAPIVPIIMETDLLDGVAWTKKGALSRVALDSTLIMEGFVMRPKAELRDRMGRRVISKIKYRDFPHE